MPLEQMQESELESLAGKLCGGQMDEGKRAREGRQARETHSKSVRCGGLMKRARVPLRILLRAERWEAERGERCTVAAWGFSHGSAERGKGRSPHGKAVWRWGGRRWR